MKTILAKTLPVAVGALALCFLASCQTFRENRPPPVTVSQIVEMSKSGVPAPDIIQNIRESGTVYRLRASELAKLREQSVPDDVIDYMQQTYVEAVRHEQYYYDWAYGPDGYWYGGFPYGWPYRDVVFIESEHRERHAEHERGEMHEHSHSGETAEHHR